jgi:hypothetical protein
MADIMFLVFSFLAFDVSVAAGADGEAVDFVSFPSGRLGGFGKREIGDRSSQIGVRSSELGGGRKGWQGLAVGRGEGGGSRGEGKSFEFRVFGF